MINGVQIIDITDPYNPTPASAITDGEDGYTELLSCNTPSPQTDATMAYVDVPIVVMVMPYGPSSSVNVYGLS